MKSAVRFLALSALLFVPLSIAHAQPVLAPISDVTVNAGDTLDVNVVAVSPSGESITLTASLPSFASLQDPTSGTGSVVTSLTLVPLDADEGTHAASVTATAGDQSVTEDFQITVAAAGSDEPPRVAAPALVVESEGNPIAFDVHASDPDGDPITSLTATGTPGGASFTTNTEFTTGTFAWTPAAGQAGEYDVVFAASNALTDSATTHFSVTHTSLGPVSIAPIADVSLAEGDTLHVPVGVTDPDKEPIQVWASLPSFATLDAPTSSDTTGVVETTITIEPGDATAGTYDASVMAASGGDTTSVSFQITVTAPPTLAAAATLIEHFNPHMKFLCFKVVPVDSAFDLRDVSLSSITLSYGDGSITTVRPTHLATDCEGDGSDCETCDQGDDAAATQVAATDTLGCPASHIMACFSMSDLLGLFGDAPLPTSLADAVIAGELTDGSKFSTAAIGGKHVAGEGKGPGQGRFSLRVQPNPMNPSADIVFTMSRTARARVAIYDLAGRLVRTLRDGVFAAGTHTVTWDGTSRAKGRVASGVYFVSVESDGARSVQRVTVLK
ncbi:MAG: putative Ig domain-containing protein [Hyphomicrobiales bacterium]